MKKSKRPPRERLIVPVIEDDAEMTPEEIKVPIPMKAPRHSDLMAPWVPT